VRVEFPTRISLTKTLIFGFVLFCVQQLEHTDLTFSILFLGFIVIGNIAFNAGGGFSKASGAYVFLFALLTAGIGVVWKAVLGEPANSNLLAPQLDMACYTASMFMLLLVILANKKLTGDSKGIAPGDLDYTLSALGCLILGLTLMALNALGAGGPGSLLSVLNQLSQFLPLAIILGTIGAIRDSDGRRTVSFVSGLAMVVVFVSGAIVFSKQGMFMSMACWFVGISFVRFRLRLPHFIVIAAFGVFAFTLAPLIAQGRQMVSESATIKDRIIMVAYIVTHTGLVRQMETESNEHRMELQGKYGYYNSSQGFIERLSILSVDDTFFNYTNKGNYIGYSPIVGYYENFIPHFLVPDKPVPIGGNFYAHEIGGFLAEGDDSTGISFSPVAEAYHIDGWTSIMLLLPAIWLSLFVGMDYICGDLRRSPWGLLVVVIFAHEAAESLLGSLVWLSGYGVLSLIVAIVFCTYFAPVVGALFYGGNRMAERASPPMFFPAGMHAPIDRKLWRRPATWLKR
jgi:hypothetical protein